MPLGMAQIGECRLIRQIVGKDETRQHLTQLGFTEGCEVTVVSAMGGSLILSLRESRIALDKALANRIIV